MGQAFQDGFKFEVDSIGNSTMTWNSANPNGKPTVNGDTITAKVEFSGLPQNNSDFGKKETRLKFKNVVVAKAEYEVFFSKNATNHPSTNSNSNWPNWMFYWLQTATPLGSPSQTFKYGSSTSFLPEPTRLL